MKLPVYKNLQRNCSIEEMEQALTVMEVYADSPAVKGEELEAVGEIISNLCGAIEVKKMINDGMEEREAANTFMKRVLGSIDK